ncbi:hypothetical protein SSX86_023853 [Deinandra increscens subsp. villosa]|uniref:CCHC-type domain-containing protein n=1 Tax=Deinandra increscens subsp. villosa TaxID=3103831 RepID=A0AAP0CLR4_9ASTR
MPPRRRATRNTSPPPAMSATDIEEMIAQRVAETVAAAATQRHADAGARGPRECSYKDFMNCKPTYFKGSEGAVGLIRWFEKLESVFRISNCPEQYMVKYSTCTFTDSALTWWNSHADAMGTDLAYEMSWDELKQLLRDEYCPREELQKLESEFWNLSMNGADIAGYTKRFRELAHLCPTMITPPYKKIERYIWGLAPHIQGNVLSSSPQTFQDAVRMAHNLIYQANRQGVNFGKKASENKPSDVSATPSSSKKPDNKRKRPFWKNRDDKNSEKAPVKETAPAKVYAATAPSYPVRKTGYTGTAPLCSKCNLHHTLGCDNVYCNICKVKGHVARDCPKRTCYGCGATGHYKSECPKMKNQGANQARGRAFVINAGDARRDPNTVTGTFLLNNHYASVLFDTGADRSFVSTDFSQLLKITPVALDTKFTVELANGDLIETGIVYPNCPLELSDHSFCIDLMPVDLGSFDVIIGMDWLAKNHAEIVCHEKMVRVPLADGNTLNVQGEKSGTKLNIISSMKARKFLRKGCHAILAHVIEKKPKEKRIEDVPVVCEYPEVFPEELPGLPPTRQKLVDINRTCVFRLLREVIGDEDEEIKTANVGQLVALAVVQTYNPSSFKRLEIMKGSDEIGLDMREFDELRKLEMFFKEEERHGCSVVDLYELVQHARNILPRL